MVVPVLRARAWRAFHKSSSRYSCVRRMMYSIHHYTGATPNYFVPAQMRFGDWLSRTRFLHADQLYRLGGDVFGGDFELLDQLPGSAGIAEAVFDANGARNHRDAIELGRLRDGARYRPGQRADLMLFGGQDHAGVTGGAHDRSRVERLERVHIEDAGLISEILLQYPGRAHGFRHHGAAGN